MRRLFCRFGRPATSCSVAETALSHPTMTSSQYSSLPSAGRHPCRDIHRNTYRVCGAMSRRDALFRGIVPHRPRLSGVRVRFCVCPALSPNPALRAADAPRAPAGTQPLRSRLLASRLVPRLARQPPKREGSQSASPRRVLRAFLGCALPPKATGSRWSIIICDSIVSAARRNVMALCSL